ncbi:MAG: VCBS repeat-containing protein [Bacteroidota bacterium]|nr:VCBS repeat-containing protein [Bacteroidota bacterium]
MKTYFSLLVLICFIISCKKSTDTGSNIPNYSLSKDALFELVDSNKSHVKFNNIVNDISEINNFTYEYFYNGGGVAIGDINNDGLQDIYFSSTMFSNKLYLNKGNLQFEDITEKAGVNGGDGIKAGVNFVDINADGWLDIFVCKSGNIDPQFRRKILYINNGNLTFTNKAAEYGLDDASYSTQSYFVDIDLDNDLDLYLLNHPAEFNDHNRLKIVKDANGNLSQLLDTQRVYVSDRLYLNEGNNKFSDITMKAGIGNKAFGLSVVVKDFNGDHYPDFYVCNDYVIPDYLYINQKNNTFKEDIDTYMSHMSQTSMGSTNIDVNNDGHLDFYSTEMGPEDNYRQKTVRVDQNYDRFNAMITYDYKAQFQSNVLQLNNKNKSYSDIAFLSGTPYTDWSWGVLAADFDNDGYEDLYIANGYRKDLTNKDYSKFTFDSLNKVFQTLGKIDFAMWDKYSPEQKLQNYFFRNKGDLSFENMSNSWNSGPLSFSNGASYADLDNDGDLDIVVNNINDPAFILENKTNEKSKNNYIRLKLTFEKENVQAIGSLVKLYLNDGSIQTRNLNPSTGFMSSVENMLHFGLGTQNSFQKIDVRWPNGECSVFENLELNKTHTLEKSTSGIKCADELPTNNSYVSNVSATSGLKFKHKENYFIDFKSEPLSHRLSSVEGPAIAVGDINGDGLEDVFLGGATGQLSRIFMQSKKGFIEKRQAAFIADSVYEDNAAIFFDGDGDGDLDLYVVSGGYEWFANDNKYADRYYINDGQGNFKKTVDAIPSNTSNGNCVAAADFDGDGDLDLFIGAGPMPKKYPFPDKHVLLQNNNGTFTDISKDIFYNVLQYGIIQDAVWKNLDNDPLPELILAGDWMPITILKYQHGTFTNETKKWGLEKSHGWWQRILIEDIDNDGDQDIIGGNLGLNSRFKVNPDQPTCIYASDYDQNGTNDAILCTYTQNTSYPIHSRDRLLDQITTLRKKYLRYHQYAQQQIDDIFPKEKLDKATIFYAYDFESSVFLNESGRYIKKPLPTLAQVSMIQGISSFDLDQDGKLDLLLCGNFYDTDLEFGRYDASIGLVCRGDGKGNFTPMDVNQSGFYVPGNIRGITPIKLANKKQGFIITENNGYVKLFAVN